MGRRFILVVLVAAITVAFLPCLTYAQAPRLRLPFAPGTAWKITQGYNTDSHGGNMQCPVSNVADPSLGVALYALDFAPDGHSKKVVFAAADGIVWRRNDATLGGILIKHSDNYYTGYMHMKNIRVQPGDRVERGKTQIGEVDMVGITTGEHLHFFLVRRKAGASDYPMETGTQAKFPLGTTDWEPIPLSFEGADFPPHSGPNDCDKHAGRQVTVPTTPPPTASTATVLVLDISGSMDDAHRGRRKIDAAKDAAMNILNMIEQESQAGQVSHQVAIATFSSGAWLDLPLTTDYAQAKNIVATLEPTAGTNIGAGLSVANQALQSAPPDSKKIVILLSDGLTNEGLPPAGILSGPVQDAADAGTCIYTVGFGDPGDLDEDLLRRIAEATGCKYYYATDAYQLENIYIKVRHESLGNVIGQFSGQVAQGDTATVGQVEVPPNQGELYVTLNWPGSRLDLILTDPKGRRVDENYPGVTISTYAKMVYAILANPIPGVWQATVFGRDVPEGTIDYNAVFSTRERVSQPTDYGPLLLVVVLMLGLAAVFLIITRATRRPAYGVRVIQGYGPGGFVGFRRRVITIGRDPRSELVLWDNKVSHYHAQIRLERGWPIIYDLNSMNGTFVNGQRVPTQMLRDGDEIRVGDTRLVFQGVRYR